MFIGTTLTESHQTCLELNTTNFTHPEWHNANGNDNDDFSLSKVYLRSMELLGDTQSFIHSN